MDGQAKAVHLTVLDPGMGNLRSVCRAWERVGATVTLAASAAEVGVTDALVFPGQGGMKNLMRELRARGFDSLLRDWIAADRPYFGICLGLQALFEHSAESGSEALGIFGGSVPRFDLQWQFKIPHMGWNAVDFVQRTPVDEALPAVGQQFYFVHSYYVQPADASLVWCVSEYGGVEFVSGIRRGNCFAVQFHPEKSQAKGLQLYRGFVQYVSTCPG